MINEPHAITAETAGFFSSYDVIYLAHNRVSSFPSVAKGQKNVKEPLVCFLFLVPGSFVLTPRHFSLPGACFCVSWPRFCSRSDKSLLLKLREPRRSVTATRKSISNYGN